MRRDLAELLLGSPPGYDQRRTFPSGVSGVTNAKGDLGAATRQFPPVPLFGTNLGATHSEAFPFAIYMLLGSRTVGGPESCCLRKRCAHVHMATNALLPGLFRKPSVQHRQKGSAQLGLAN